WVHTELQRLLGIDRVKINAVTGSLLVFFDKAEDWQTINERINKLIQRLARNGFRPPLRATSAGRPRGQADKWHQLEAGRVLALSGTTKEQGLDPGSAARRMQTSGRNVVQEAALRRRSATLRDQLLLLPMTLIVAEAIAALIGGAALEAGLLMLTMGFNVMAGYLIDRRAEKTIATFKHRPRPPALVRRGGAWIEVAGEALVVGDIIKLAPGTYVGSDCRILEAAHLKIDESLLTGESHPVDKHADVIRERTTPLFDRRNMAFMGTLVVGGEGRAVVVATGPMTIYGRLNALFNETVVPETPVISKIHILSGTLLRVALVMSGGVLLSGIMRGRGLLSAIGRAIAIAAAGMPAGLPSAATVNMALGFKRLQRQNILIRRLYSLESLSAVQIICFDKTGTLTRSRISVQQIHCGGRNLAVRRRSLWDGPQPFAPLEDPDFDRLLQACVLCSESRVQWEGSTGQQRITGSPTEVALLHLAIMAGLDPDRHYHNHPLKNVRHRSENRRYMISVHATSDHQCMVWLKGDPAEVLEMCVWEQRGGRRVALTDLARQTIDNQNQRMAGEALRVLGFAYCFSDKPPDDRMLQGEFTWVGLVGMAEPIREGVSSLIEKLHQGGIRTVMITGDQSATAEAVARRIRLGGPTAIRIFDSSRFDTLSSEQTSALIRNVQVFSRFNPAQKLQIIQAYQDQGMVVAMTGDGINDGPALRAADVGIAMGLSGTHAAREVADMVLGRDNITSVATAIQEGRTAYRNLKRALRFFITTHFSDVMMTTAASSFALGASLRLYRPVQLGLLTDLAPGLALLMEPPHPDIGREAPRDRKEPLFVRDDLGALFTESAVLTAGGLAAFGYGLTRYGSGAQAATLAYQSLAAAKLLHALTCRPWSSRRSAPKPKPSNRFLNAALTAALAAQAGTILIPGLRRLLGMAPLGPADLVAVGLSAWSTRSINRRLRGQRKTEAQTA
ncbi:MAG: HAD-IC family P-type ATPase, partial [Desulfobacterales bacterium]